MPRAQSCVITNRLRGEDHTERRGGQAGGTARMPAGPIPRGPRRGQGDGRRAQSQQPEGHDNSAGRGGSSDRGRVRLGGRVVLPSDASVLSHVFWKYFIVSILPLTCSFLARALSRHSLV